MKKKPAYDLDELLQQSIGITNHVAVEEIGGIKRFKRQVSELQESYKHLGKDASDQMGKAGIKMLLSEQKFDANSLTDDINTLDFEVPETPYARFEGTDIEGHLAHLHDTIILGAIESASRTAENDAREIERRWAADNWKAAKQDFIDNLGRRAQTLNTSHNNSKFGAIIPITRVAKDAVPVAPSTGRLVFSPYSSKPTDDNNIGGWATRKNVETAIIVPLPEAIDSHAKIVRNLIATKFGIKTPLPEDETPQIRRLNSKNTPLNDLSNSVSDLREKYGELSDLGFNSTDIDRDIDGYRSCLQLLGEMVTGGDHKVSVESNQPGFFSPLRLHQDALETDRRRDILNGGAKLYFEREFAEALTTCVETEFRGGRVGRRPFVSQGSLTMRELQDFVELKIEREGIPEGCVTSYERNLPLWLLVCTGIKAGNLALVAEILEKICIRDRSADVQSCMITAVLGYRDLAAFLSNQNNSGSDRFSEFKDHAYRTSFRRAILDCRNLYSKEQEINSATTSDPYKLDFLNLMSLFSIDEFSVVNDNTESYLWCHIWFIQFSRALFTSNIFDADSNNNIIVRHSDQELYQAIADVGGDEYFDDDKNSAFIYVSVLFACHRFTEGIFYLWREQKLFPAVHLLSMALYYGLILPHEPFYSIMGSLGNSAGASSTITAATIIQSWAEWLYLRGYPEYALDYIMFLNAKHCWSFADRSNANVRKQEAEAFQKLELSLEKLVSSCEGTQIAQLFGDIGKTPLDKCYRTSGFLDNYFERDVVNRLLCRAAYRYCADSNAAQEGLRLYYMAGDYVEAVKILCKQLSQHAIPHSLVQHDYAAVVRESNKQREYWISASLEFYTSPLCLGSNNNQAPFGVGSAPARPADNFVCRSIDDDLLRAFTTLLNISFFANLMVEKSFERALGILEKTEFIPSSESSAHGYSHRVVNLHSDVKAVLDDTLIVAAYGYRDYFDQLQREKAAVLRLRGNTPVGSKVLDDKIQKVVLQRKAMKSFVMNIRHSLSRSDTSDNIAFDI